MVEGYAGTTPGPSSEGLPMLDFLVSTAHSSPLALALVALLVAWGESIPGLGFLLPGEMTIVALSSLALDPAQTVLLWLAVALGAVCGDHLGYGTGRAYGERVHAWPLVRRIDVEHWARAEAFVRRRGAPAIVASRMLPVVRTLVPVVAGIGGLRYRAFVAASIVGCLLWAAFWVTCGAALHAALGPAAGPALAGGCLSVMAAAGAALLWRRLRRVATA